MELTEAVQTKGVVMAFAGKAIGAAVPAWPIGVSRQSHTTFSSCNLFIVALDIVTAVLPD